MPKPNNDRRFYGTITVSERGQIVIPAEARRDFKIAVGDKLLVFGDVEKGLWITNASMLIDIMPGFTSILDSETGQVKEDKNE